MSWSSWKKKEPIVCTVYFAKENFFKICALFQSIMYWIHFQYIHTFIYQKTLLHTFLLFVFKIVESLQYILNENSTSKKLYEADLITLRVKGLVALFVSSFWPFDNKFFSTLPENCPNTEFFLVRIFPY